MKDPREVFGRVAVVGSGGGFRGAAIPSFFEPLARRGVFRAEDGYLGATSVSALVEFRLSCARNQEELSRFVAETRDVFRYIAKSKKGARIVFPFPPSWQVPARAWNSKALLDGKTLFELVKNVDPEKSINSPTIFEFTVLDEKTNRRITLSNKDERFRGDPELLRRAVVASASVRPIFPPVKVGDDVYSDGGSVDLMSAVRCGCDTIFVLFPYPKEHSELKPEGFFERHYPLISDFLTFYPAGLRTLDAAELERVAMHSELLAHRFAIKSLEKEIDQLQGEVSFLKAAQVAEGLVARLRNTLAILKNKMLGLESGSPAERAVPVRVIPLWADPPETLTPTGFKANDFEIVGKRAGEEMERELDKWLK